MPNVTRQHPPRPNSTAPRRASPPAPTPNSSVEDEAWGAATGLRLLVYGKSGTGKTTLASTFPDPIRWLLCTGGQRPGELKSIDTPENRRRVRPVIITGDRDGDRPLEGELDDIAADPGRYRTVVLDHVGGLQDFILQRLLHLDRPPAQRPIIGDNKRTWGEVAGDMKEHVRKIFNLPCNVVLVAHDRAFGPGDESEVAVTTVGPAVIPSLAGWLSQAADYTCQTFIRPVYTVRSVKGPDGKPLEQRVRGKGWEYCLRTEQSDVYHSKFRVPGKPVLPECLVDPDYTKIMALINGEV
jgi:hypothetical protein